MLQPKDSIIAAAQVTGPVFILVEENLNALKTAGYDRPASWSRGDKGNNITEIPPARTRAFQDSTENTASMSTVILLERSRRSVWSKLCGLSNTLHLCRDPGVDCEVASKALGSLGKASLEKLTC